MDKLQIIFIISLFAIAYFKGRKREDVWFRIKYGEICYKCKCLTEDIDWVASLSNDDAKMTLCESCKRDENINTILSGNIISKVKIKFYNTDKIRKLSGILNIVSALLNLLSIWYRPLGFFGGLILSTSLWISYRNFLLTSFGPKLKKS